MDKETKEKLVQKSAERLRRKWHNRDRKREERRLRAREAAREIAAQLGSKDEGLQKVIGFGSAFETWRTFREDSDIDLAIIGGDWFRLSRNLPHSEFHISLVELDEQNEEFRRHVLEAGEVLYEKE